MANKAQGLLDKFVDSIGDLLNDITALEVNTMLVAEITGAKFNAWEAYQIMYSVSDMYIKNTKIPSELYERYENLFEKLERDYFYILIDKDSGLDDLRDETVVRYRKRLNYLKDKKDAIANLTEVRPILPDPSDADIKNWSKIQRILDNGQFLRSLRKIIELKAALDSSDPTKDGIDIIYAQTVMQLDGDIITRYHQKLFDREDIKDLVLKTHNEGIVAGEKQWRGLLDFMVDLLKSVKSGKPPWLN